MSGRNRKVGNVVLDASAVIALLRGEKGADVVASAIPGATISAVNLSEVATWLSDAGSNEDQSRLSLGGFEFECEAFDGEAAYEAAALRKITRSQGLSLGDRACLALALSLGLPVLTADRNWAKLKIGVDVQLIRE